MPDKPYADGSSVAEVSSEVRIPGLKQHVAVLDGIRGLAITLVCIDHFWEMGGSAGELRTYGLFAGFGWSGVELFFVLSGLLITGILLESRGTPS